MAKCDRSQSVWRIWVCKFSVDVDIFHVVKQLFERFSRIAAFQKSTDSFGVYGTMSCVRLNYECQHILFDFVQFLVAEIERANRFKKVVYQHGMVDKS